MLRNMNEDWKRGMTGPGKIIWGFHVSVEVNANAPVFADETRFSELAHGAGALSVIDTVSLTTMAVNI